MNEAELTSQSRPIAESSTSLVGTVLSGQANYYWVRLDSDTEYPPVGEETASPSGVERLSLLCTRRSRLKKIGQQVWVGDRVRIEEPDWFGGRGAIAEVLPRQSELDRPPIANVEQILLVFALAEPDLESIQLSRFLVKAESTGLRVCLGLNKSDLVSMTAQRHWCDRLQQWGYDPIVFSIRARQNLSILHRQLQDRVTVVAGPSGVGKSSLISQLIPTVDLRIGAVSGKLGRGRHTTRHVELFELPTGGFLADTPGFNQPDLELTPAELANTFPEIRQRLAHQTCHFNDCLHRDEPNCVIRGDWERYDHYLTFLEQAIAYQDSLERTTDEEATLKVKVGEAGQSHFEPKLESKRYRRPSRRTQRQSLKELCRDIEDLALGSDEAQGDWDAHDD